MPGMVLSKGYVTGGIRHGYCPFIYPKWDFPGGPEVGSQPANAGDTGSIPGPRTRIPCAAG